MNFPMQLPIFQFFYWLVNTVGLGGIAVSILSGGALLAYGATLRWIHLGGQAKEPEAYSYPDPALHAHEEME
jgi:hypothetical protein